MDGNEAAPGTTRRAPVFPFDATAEQPTPEARAILETAKARSFTQALAILQEADAEVAAGGVMLQIWRAVSKDARLIGEPAELESLRFTMTAHAILDFGRQHRLDRKRHWGKKFDFDEVESRQPTPDQSLDREAFYKEVGRALAKLGPRAAEIWQLKYVAELSADEIATQLGIEKSGVVTQAYKANLVVREHLARHEYGNGNSRGKQS